VVRLITLAAGYEEFWHALEAPGRTKFVYPSEGHHFLIPSTWKIWQNRQYSGLKESELALVPRVT